MPRRFPNPAPVLLALALSAGLQGLPAADIEWGNTATDYNAGASWAGGTAPGPGDAAVFSSAATNQPDLSANITNQQIRFATSTGGWTLNGTSALTLTSTAAGTGSALVGNNTSGTNTINAAIILGGAAATTATFNQAAGGTLAITGNISSTNAITGISLAGASGSVFTLSGNNTYTGTTTLSSGTIRLNINSATAIGSGALVFSQTATTIDNTSTGAITLANNNNITIAQNFTFAGTQDLSFGSGTATLGSTRTITVSAGNLTIGAIDASFTNVALTKSGAGRLILTNAAGANFQGGTTLSAGTLSLGHKNALGSGTLTISAASTALSSTTDLSGANAVANNINLRNNSSIVGSNNLTLSGALTQNGSDLSLTVNNSGATELAGPIYLSEASGTGRTLMLVATTNTTVSGAISNFNGSGTAGALRKNGAGALVLSSSSSSYTGRTETQAAGILSVAKLANGGSNSSIGASSNAAGNLVFANGTTLLYTGSGDSTDRLFTIDGSGAGLGVAIDASGTGALNFTNTGSITHSTSGQTRTLTLQGNSTADNTFALLLANNGGGALSVAKSGTGTWILAGNNTYSGGTTISAGTLQLGTGGSTGTVAGDITNNSVLAFNRSDNFTYGNIVSGSGSVTKNGSGMLTLSGNNTYTGATTINAGTLRLGAGGTSGNVTSDIANNSSLVFDRSNNFTYGNTISGTGSVTKNGSGTLTLAGANTYSGGTTINAGALTIEGTANGNNTISGNITVNTGGTLQHGSNNNVFANTTNVAIAGGTFAVGARTETLGSIAMSGGSLGKGGGVLTLGGASSFTGGTVNMTAATARIATSGTTTLGDVTFTTGSNMASGDGLVLGGDVSMTAGTANFVNTANSGRINLGASDRIFEIGSGAALNSNWVVSGSGGLTKSGAGTMTLNATNTYSGNTTVTAGTLATSGANQISTSTSLDVQGGTFQLGGNQQFASAQGAGNIALAANTLTLGSNNASTTLSGTISGAGGALAKGGTGTVTLSGNNSYSGGTTLSGGTLALGHKNALGTGALTISAASTALSSTADLSGANAVANDIILRNNSSIVGSNNLTLSGALTQNGSSLSLTVNNAGATELAGPVYLSEASGTGRTLTLVATTNITVSGAISNFNGSGTAGALRKDGAGALVLSSSSSSYTGRTETMSGGILSVSKLANGGSNSSIGASTNAAGNLVLANGTTLRYTGSGDSTDRLFTIDGSGAGLGVAIDASGSGALNFTNTGSVANSISGQTRTLTLQGSSTENNTFAPRISNNGAGAVSVAKSGAGKWILAGNNTYTGATTVNAGTLLVDGSIAAGSTTSVAAGATLGGSGTISGVANVYGKLAPGNGPGILAFGSALNLDSSAQIDMELNGTTRGAGYDGMNVGGLLTYGGQLALTVGSRFLESSQSFSLFSFAAQPAGNLGSVELSGAYGGGPFASAGGGNWQLTDTEGNQWVFSQANGQLSFTAVPEPSTWALVFLGASLLAAARFRRKY